MHILTICGSLKFLEQMNNLKAELEQNGLTVYIPEAQEKKEEQSMETLKKQAIDAHLAKIRTSDAILVANYTKNGVANYIGANAFLEMGFAYALNKDIFVLHDIPNQANTEEIKALKPNVLRGNVSKIVSF